MNIIENEAEFSYEYLQIKYLREGKYPNSDEKRGTATS